MEIANGREWGGVKTPPVLLAYDFDAGNQQLVHNPEAFSSLLLRGRDVGVTTWMTAQVDSTHATRTSPSIRNGMTKIHLSR